MYMYLVSLHVLILYIYSRFGLAVFERQPSIYIYTVWPACDVTGVHELLSEHLQKHSGLAILLHVILLSLLPAIVVTLDHMYPCTCHTGMAKFKFFNYQKKSVKKFKVNMECRYIHAYNITSYRCLHTGTQSNTALYSKGSVRFACEQHCGAI